MKSNISTVLCLIPIIALLCSCSSSIKKVIPDDAPSMEKIYNSFSGNYSDDISKRKQLLLKRPATENHITGSPPDAQRIAHLFPSLPNPDLFMYVRPHVRGKSGLPIPAYITRFTMYERNHYALPGEIIETVRAPSNAVLDTENGEQIQ